MSVNTELTRAELVAMLADSARQAIISRDRAIVEMVAAGASQREVARAAGLSHTAVQQILRRAVAA